MASIGRKLEKKGVIAMTLLTLVLIGTSCEDRIDNPAVHPSERETVEVSLNIGVADEEDGYTLSTKSTASSDKGAFSCQLQPATVTKGDASIKPDKLYRLEIIQYDNLGTYKNRLYINNDDGTAIGSKINLSFTKLDDCQLVIVAWGKGNTTTLGTNNLANAQKVTIPAATIESIDPTKLEDMNKMPYLLHLKHVNVGDGNTIKSIDGQDARLLLKRLATRLTISWSYDVTSYTLKQIILQSIPSNYKVVAAPDENNKYPSELDQYNNIQLTEQEIKNGSYSRWIPANVRGFNTASNSPLYRIKANAPTGSAYASFIAVNDNDIKKKFNYRVYLGGKDYSDFNLYENTDYNYTVTINHDGIPTNDRRVTYIDPIPASENNENFVNTANCFMVAPGGYFNFNPYNYYVNGKNKEGGNELLREWCKSSKIQSVKVLWQTLENGDLGDPVLGTVNSSDDHTNIVDIKMGTNFDDARIYCRVAPNTTGGSGVIAAYSGKDGTGDILWSWHIWVTDYSPDATGNIDVQTPTTKRKQKYSKEGLSNQLPMMDRNLGAMTGYITVPPTPLEMSKTNGFHYQWGRKDPFRSSYTSEVVGEVSVPVPNTAPVKNLLSFYQADGISYYQVNVSKYKTNYQVAYKNPNILYNPEGGETEWNTEQNTNYTTSWGSNGSKGLHDPCPAGWWICSIDNYKPLFTDTGCTILNLVKDTNIATDGGYLVKYDNTHTTYIRVTGYWYADNLFSMIGIMGYYWPRTKGDMLRLITGLGKDPAQTSLKGSNFSRAGMPVRCIQERE